jgi:solute carrier family 25 (mitochondrial uncoupling protein), member 8/9
MQQSGGTQPAFAVDPPAPTHSSTSFAGWGQRSPLVAGFAASAVSVATATFLTNWVDVIKVRQQLAGAHGRNLLLTGVAVVKEDGTTALFRGVTPAVARGLLYGGLRIGLYSPFKQALSPADGSDPSLASKIAAGMGSGAIAAGVCNPTDLVKTRMQMAGAAPKRPLAVAADVIRSEGLAGLWKGTTPSMARAALLTAAQCATYDEVKLLFTRRFEWSDGIGTHLTVSGIAGLVTTTVTAPVDMIKVRLL